jgi:exosortase/archaeosortase family protein
MKWLKTFAQLGHNYLRRLCKTTHGRIVLSGLAIGLCYLPVWLFILFKRTGRGSASMALLLPLLFLAFHELWKHRKELAAVSVPEEDRLLGHILILSGVVLFPFCRFAIWSQSILWLMILAGIACSSWGMGFFRKYLLSTVLIALSVYPRPGETARILWEAFTPPYLLNRFMAWAAALGLQAIGHPAQVVHDFYISLPQGAVEVGWGCNGFSMASNIAIAGLVLGLFLKQRWSKITILMGIGVVLSLVFNVPRVMLVTIASVYWGKYWFDFWHHSWGAQIFVSVIFTIYYYGVMAIVKQRPKQN